MEMKVWVCETWETDGYDRFGEHITLWYKKKGRCNSTWSRGNSRGR